MCARWYDASLGRFISEDPIKGSMLSSQSQNPYVYCMNNPLRYVDPSGMLLTDDPGHVDGFLQTYYGGEYHYYMAMDGSCNGSGIAFTYGDALEWRSIFEALSEYANQLNNTKNFANSNEINFSGLPGEYFKNMTSDKYNATRFGDKSMLFYVLGSFVPESNPTISIYLQLLYETATGKSDLFTGIGYGLGLPGVMIISGFLDFDTIEEYKNTPTVDVFGGQSAMLNLTFGYRNNTWELVGVGGGGAWGRNLGFTNSGVVVDESINKVKDILNHYIPT